MESFLVACETKKYWSVRAITDNAKVSKQFSKGSRRVQLERIKWGVRNLEQFMFTERQGVQTDKWTFYMALQAKLTGLSSITFSFFSATKAKLAFRIPFYKKKCTKDSFFKTSIHLHEKCQTIIYPSAIAILINFQIKLPLRNSIKTALKSIY